MNDIKKQEHLRDTIGNVLEMSRASWRLKNKRQRDEDDAEEGDFPRSMLVKTVTGHPLATVAVVAALWYIGPARFGAMAVAGASLLLRHRLSLLPLAEQLMTSNMFKTKKKPIHTPAAD